MLCEAGRDSTTVKLCAEYACIEMWRLFDRESVVDRAAGTEEGEEMCRGTV